MSGRDYYAVLGVARDAGADEIRRAYRKLARVHHPDVNKSPDAAKKFTEVQQAYDVLSDEQKRRLYDQFGEDAVSGARSAGGQEHARGWPGGRPSARQPGTSNVDFDDLSSMFDAMFSGGGPGPKPKSRSGRSSGPRSSRRQYDEHQPEPLRHDLHVSFMTAVKGGVETLRVESAGSDSNAKRTVEVRIPAGIADGSQLRVRNPTGQPGGPDLLLTIRVGEHPIFHRREPSPTDHSKDLWLDVPITIAEATLGGGVTIPTLDGRVELTIPPGTSSGKRLRLKGKGVCPVGESPGDLYAVIKVVTPGGTDLSEDEKSLLQRLSSRTPNPRSGAGWT
jgi:DnaJ-class molecular chaperone